MLRKKKTQSYKRVRAVQFNVHEVLGQAKLIYGDRDWISDCPNCQGRLTGKGQWGTFRTNENILYLVWAYGYAGVCFY